MTRKGAFAAIAVVVALTLGALLTVRTPEVKLPSGLELALPAGDMPGSLKVPIVHYERHAPDGSLQRLDFVGAVHLGEAGYYEGLNERFAQYDAVLFELVGDPEAFKLRDASQGQSPIGFIQQGLGELLGLRFQLEGINYNAPNFVHADLSMQQLKSAMTARGESVASLLLKLLLLSFDPKVQEDLKTSGYEEPELEGINPVMVVLRGPTPEERRKLRLFFAKGLVSSDVIIKQIQGESGTSLIDDRNAAAVQVAKQQLDAGRGAIAVFYGVGHMQDLDKRFREDLGFSIVEVEWVQAWKL